MTTIQLIDDARRAGCRPLLVAAILLLSVAAADAGVKSRAIRELAESLANRGGRQASKSQVDTMARQIETLALHHGDEAVTAVRKVGPDAIELVLQAGKHGDDAVKLLARHGDDAVWIVSRPGALSIFVKYGDDAAEAMIKHRQIAAVLLELFGEPAGRAMIAVNSRNARRLAMLHNGGTLGRMGRTTEVLEVIGRYGNRAAEFVWKHKAALVIATVLAAFLNDPEPFLDGVRDIAEIASENIARPVAEAPGKFLDAAGKTVDGNSLVNAGIVTAVSGLVLITLLLAFRMLLSTWARRRRRSS